MEKLFSHLSEDELKRQIAENSRAIDQLLKELKDSPVLLTSEGRDIL
ncbi:hypothetical protein [Ruminiclostridium cellobioparum]|jgi:hypothetical protein|nr:hypothetical protein [Ruminiclostridium cellobioparum]